MTIGTKGLLGEGLDCSSWANLVLASPISGESPIQQAIGRVIRGGHGKTEGLVVDLVDPHAFGWSSFANRRKVYNMRNWPMQQANR